MADATKLTNFKFFEWSRPSTAPVTLTAPYSTGDTTLYWSAAPRDEDGTIITGGFTVGVVGENGDTADFWVAPGAVAGDGLSATVVLQGRAGTDLDTANTTYDVDFPAGSGVIRVLSPVEQQILINTLQGLIATGAASFTVGTEGGAETMTLNRTTTAGVTLGVLRWNLSTTKVEFSNNGSTWTAIDDTVASVLFKISAADTTPGYAEDKLVAGDNVTITKQNTGANENLLIAASSQREGVTTHTTYTPAFLTGGGSPETTIAIWDSVSDGSFRLTLDGTAYNVDGIDFTAPVTSMGEVASTIQAALRVVTGSTETVTWSGTEFVITSADTTASSSITVLTTSTGTVGTDISGVAGGSRYMDSNVGNGVATAAVVDPTADTGKVPLLNSNGNVDTDLLREVIPTGGYTAKGEILAASAADTPALVTAGSNGQVLTADSGETAGVKYDTPLYVGVGSNLQSGVEGYQIPWVTAQVTSGDSWTAAGTATATTYAYNWAFLSTTNSRTLITTNAIFNAFVDGNAAADPLRWGNTAYTTVIAEFQFQFDADVAIGTNGFGFGLVSNVSSLTDYDDATNEGVNFAVDASGNLYAHTSNGSSSTETAIAGITLANRNTYRIEYDRNSEARFYVNGTLEATISTTLPVGTSGGDEIKFGVGITDNGGTVEAALSAINVALIR
jgi:hypothetical protein